MLQGERDQINPFETKSLMPTHIDTTPTDSLPVPDASSKDRAASKNFTLTATQEVHGQNEPLYTQGEAIDYEVARETITILGAILMREIYDEEAKNWPDAARVSSLCDEHWKLLEERENLHVKDHAEIARIRTEYGSRVRAWREQRCQAIAAVG